jgi:poly-gamma-glutamate synthesis protein (capsule biosynthesis protein)
VKRVTEQRQAWQRDPSKAGSRQLHSDRGAGDLHLIAAGDALMSQSLNGFSEPRFTQLLELISAADAGFINLEGVVRNRDEGTPQAESGGTWVSISPAHARELTQLGFNLFATAHNHSLDWGADGLLAMNAHLDALGVTHAGVGPNLAAARQPAYLDTPKGRVALISAATSFNNWNRAGNSRPDCQGRPGLNGIRIRTMLQVTPDEFTVLQHLNRELKLDAKTLLREKLGFKSPAAPGTLTFGQYEIRTGPVRQLLQEPDARDLAGLLSAVHEARRQADWVVFSVHNHELGDGKLEVPPVWLQDLCRRVIDAGADMVVGHGPHVLQGIELHDGKPILYSLGNFIFQNETQAQQPADFYEAQGLGPEHGPADLFDRRAKNGGFAAHAHYWQSVLADLEWSDGQLARLRLHPVTLGMGLRRSLRGRPMLACLQEGERIIRDLASLSEGFGTTIRWEAGYGTVLIR